MPVKKNLWLGRISVTLGIIFVILLLLALLGGAKFKDLWLGFVACLILIKYGRAIMSGKPV
ncbi:MAG: hypothetical protein AAB647_00655 [Patescibacteria group bacterium]